jgi:hypothetical protein
MCDPDVISDTVLATVSGELRPSSDNVISNRFAQRIQPVARFTRATPRFVQKAENLLRTTRSTFDHRFKDPTLQRFSASVPDPAGSRAENVFRPARSYQGLVAGVQSSNGKVDHWA